MIVFSEWISQCNYYKMGSPLDLLNAFRNTDVVLVAQDAINESADFMVQLNNQQLDQGLRSSGAEFPDYSRVSQEYYDKPNGPYTIKKTGELRRGLYYEAVGDIVHYGSTGATAPLAEGNPNIGQTAYGITLENKVRYLKPALQVKAGELLRKFNGFV